MKKKKKWYCQFNYIRLKVCYKMLNYNVKLRNKQKNKLQQLLFTFYTNMIKITTNFNKIKQNYLSLFDTKINTSEFYRSCQVFFFLFKSYRYSSSCERAAAILLPVEELQVFFFLWKNSRYSSSYRRAACNFLFLGKLEVFPASRRDVSILLHVEDLQVFFFLFKSCRYSSSFGRAAAKLLSMEGQQVSFFL